MNRWIRSPAGSLRVAALARPHAKRADQTKYQREGDSPGRGPAAAGVPDRSRREPSISGGVGWLAGAVCLVLVLLLLLDVPAPGSSLADANWMPAPSVTAATRPESAVQRRRRWFEL